MSKNLILLIGAPGSGKTTDGSIVAKNHLNEITHYSLGNLLKEEIEKGTVLGKIDNDYVSKGDLVPTAIAIDTVCSAISKASTETILIDGFPREGEQMKVFEDIVSDENRIKLLSVIEVRVSDDVAKNRFLETEGDEETFNHMMEVYKNTISDIEKFYEKQGLLKVIDGERELEEVIVDIEKYLKELIS